MHEKNDLQNKKLKNKWYVIFCSLMMALYMEIPMINQIVIAMLPSMAGKVMTALYILCALCVCAVIGYSTIKGRRINIKLLACLTIVVVLYLLTNLFTTYSELELVQFISYTVLAILIPSVFEINGKLFLRASMTYSIFGIFYIEKIFHITNVANQTIGMGISYAFLPTIIAATVYLMLYVKEDQGREKTFFLFVILINVFYFFKIIQYGSRGPVFSILLCIFFLICFKYKVAKGRIAPVGIKFILLGIGVILVLANISTVLGTVQMLLNAQDIHIHTIDKIIRLSSSSEGISNGRTVIYRSVLEEIAKNPLLGYGMSTSMHNIGINYPHNFILQMIYDGGIFLTVPILGFAIAGLLKILRHCNLSEYAVVVAMFFMSVPGAMVSGDLWENNRLWLVISMLILGAGIRKFIVI